MVIILITLNEKRIERKITGGVTPENPPRSTPKISISMKRGYKMRGVFSFSLPFQNSGKLLLVGHM
ncbi:hypothetical protein DRO29_07950 [Candidatus Bathyarchaeota archaeon]|nr:MAG: hypothetical protein DRO29_07950 [Candidatus Bathyarchaeota archaeon]